ncbi:MAG: O-antigen ligase family protein [Cyanobacteria bacterium P01_H01_bin.74]
MSFLTFGNKNNAETPPLSQLAVVLLVSLLVPLMTHGLLPMLGVRFIADRFSTQGVFFIFALLAGFTFYSSYFLFITKRPVFMVVYSSVFVRLTFYIAALAHLVGKHIPVRSLHAPLLVLPGYYLGFIHFSALWKTYSYFKYVVIFLCLFVFYYVFFNYNFVDPIVAKTSGVSISKGQLTDYIYASLGIIIPGAMFIQAGSAENRIKLFNIINHTLLIGAIAEAVLSILGYPVGLFTMKVEGFRRTSGLMEHPNAYGKIAGLFLIYFIGLYYYYVKNPDRKTALLDLLLQIAIASNLLAFLLTLSKNAFAGFFLACVIYLVSALFDNTLRQKLILPLMILSGLVVVLLAGYQMVSEKDLMSLLTDRFNDTRSLEWRTRVWGYLLSNINKTSVWFGHGLSACNMEMYRYQYNDAIASEKQSLYVHNALIQFLYDMGIVGLTIFASYLNAVLSSAQNFFKDNYNPLYLCIIGLSFFVLLGTLTDECITEFHMNFMYWFMVTMIISFCSALSTKPAPSRIAQQNRRNEFN